MPVLHNRVSQNEMKKRLYEETEPRITISFYNYFPIPEPQVFRDDLYKALHVHNVFGRIYIATEGINAQVSVPKSRFEDFKTALDQFDGLRSLRLNTAVDDDGKSFWVLKIKVRKQIVADGITDPAFNMEKKGKYVNALEFNEMTNDPDTIVVDMRNHYEFEVGHFENAVEIASDTFREQLPMAAEKLGEQKKNRIIMYCTGGIRCEKASAYMLHRGFENVFHLEGGIINYVASVRQQKLPNKFRGKNFVFDGRLGEKVTDDVISLCHQCGQPADDHTNCRNEACHLLFIQCATCAQDFSGCCSMACVDIINLPEDEQAVLRRGKDKGQMIFNKSRHRGKKLTGN